MLCNHQRRCRIGKVVYQDDIVFFGKVDNLLKERQVDHRTGGIVREAKDKYFGARPDVSCYLRKTGNELIFLRVTGY